jgi:hypothetical protein
MLCPSQFLNNLFVEKHLLVSLLRNYNNFVLGLIVTTNGQLSHDLQLTPRKQNPHIVTGILTILKMSSWLFSQLKSLSLKNCQKTGDLKRQF